MKLRRQETLDLNAFGNAVRECLGLHPIYTDGRSMNRETEKTDEFRFYGRVHTWDRPGFVNGRRMARF